MSMSLVEVNKVERDSFRGWMLNEAWIGERVTTEDGEVGDGAGTGMGFEGDSSTAINENRGCMLTSSLVPRNRIGLSYYEDANTWQIPLKRPSAARQSQ